MLPEASQGPEKDILCKVLDISYEKSRSYLIIWEKGKGGKKGELRYHEWKDKAAET